MPPVPARQEKFRQRVLKRLIEERMSITSLAQRLGKRRESVSRAIHRRHHAKLGQSILHELGLPLKH